MCAVQHLPMSFCRGGSDLTDSVGGGRQGGTTRTHPRGQGRMRVSFRPREDGGCTEGLGVCGCPREQGVCLPRWGPEGWMQGPGWGPGGAKPDLSCPGSWEQQQMFSRPLPLRGWRGEVGHQGTWTSIQDFLCDTGQAASGAIPPGRGLDPPLPITHQGTCGTSGPVRLQPADTRGLVRGLGPSVSRDP